MGGYVGAPDRNRDRFRSDPPGKSARWRSPDRVPDWVGAGGVNVNRHPGHPAARLKGGADGVELRRLLGDDLRL
jgi:hypothetical protein